VIAVEPAELRGDPLPPGGSQLLKCAGTVPDVLRNVDDSANPNEQPRPGRSVKLDVKESGATLIAALDLIDSLALGDDRVWFNAEIEVVGPEASRRSASVIRRPRRPARSISSFHFSRSHRARPTPSSTACVHAA
jgi:hypothetical protein